MTTEGVATRVDVALTDLQNLLAARTIEHGAGQTMAYDDIGKDVQIPRRSCELGVAIYRRCRTNKVRGTR